MKERSIPKYQIGDQVYVKRNRMVPRALRNLFKGHVTATVVQVYNEPHYRKEPLYRCQISNNYFLNFENDDLIPKNEFTQAIYGD